MIIDPGDTTEGRVCDGECKRNVVIIVVFVVVVVVIVVPVSNSRPHIIPPSHLLPSTPLPLSGCFTTQKEKEDVAEEREQAMRRQQALMARGSYISSNLVRIYFLDGTHKPIHFREE